MGCCLFVLLYTFCLLCYYFRLFDLVWVGFVICFGFDFVICLCLVMGFIDA